MALVVWDFGSRATARQRSNIIGMESYGVIHFITIVSIVGVIRIRISIVIGIAWTFVVSRLGLIWKWLTLRRWVGA